MPTIRLVPSIATRSNSNYLTLANESNMYTNVDSTTYGTCTHTRSSSSTYYLYLGGFNFDDVPDDAIINSFTVKIKASATGQSTSSSYRMSLYHSTTAISNTTVSSSLSTTVQTLTFPTSSLDFATIKGYGDNFRIRIPLRRANSGTQVVASIYGAEIEVDYTMPVYHNVTLSNSTSATVVISDTTPLEGTDVEVVTDTLTGITVKDNGTDVTNQFVQASSGTEVQYPASYTTSGSISGTNYQSAIGKGSDAADASGNDYCSSSGSTAHIDYAFDFSEIPAGATIQSVSVSVKGHCESTSSSSEVAECQLYSGSTAKGSVTEFTSTSDAVYNMTTGTWTWAELQDAVLRFTIGYYGGRLVGATWTVVYEMSGYVYTITNISGDHAIVVTASGGETSALYVKINGSWVEVAEAYRKVNGAWVQVSDITTLFDSSTHYVSG